jgi:hypothetical protein
MRAVPWLAILGLVAWGGLAVSAGGPTQPVPPKSEATCAGHGTAVDFFDNVREAAARAQKEQKLVFVLHVSGHFEDPDFT